MNPKAANYIEQLNSARCEGNWDAVPELVRKVRKHAPERTCLTLAAETECAISRVTAAGARPFAAQTAQDLDVSNRFPNLLAAIEQEVHHHEDRVQAKVCLGWLNWVVGDYAQALGTLPTSLDAEGLSPERVDVISEWTNLCALKSGYLQANCLMRNDKRAEALAALKSATPSLDGVWCGQGVRKQLRYWSELFLTEYCMLSSQALENDGLNLHDPDSLAGFRAWARYWNVMGAPITGGFGFKGSVPRRRIWSEYYEILSRILENDLPYVPGHVESISADLPPRAQLRLEIKQTETAYRALILTETTFPKADEDRLEVEAFVTRVMSNWAILCGRGWREQDLGPGGRGALSRTVLETLYSAATRTYHSTSILRSLFSVHLAVAEFDLAFKAFDSYLAIVKKGKARVEKTGHEEVSLDDDATVLQTMAQAVMALCRYGDQTAGEKARHLGAELENWLSKLPPQTRSNGNGSPVNGLGQAKTEPGGAHVPLNVISLAWQAIGLSHAHWSRITHEASSRTEIQAKAIRCLRKSLAAEFGRSKDIRSFFSLALLLAERRDLTAAIELVRSALLCNRGQEESYSLLHGPCWQERTLIPVWHLLALLLSARQDYTMAARACEGALQQFKDPSILFGKADASFRSDKLKEGDANSGMSEAPPARGLVDDMDDSEKESILEVKMTQLALIELVDGPDAAVNASLELLSLFSRMFGTLSAAPQPAKSPAPSLPQKTSGTIRSLRGSLFGAKQERSTTSAGGPQGSMSTASEGSRLPSRPTTSHDARNPTPAIHVTEQNASRAGERGRRRSSSGPPGTKSRSRQRNGLGKRAGSGSQTRTSPGSASEPHHPTVLDGEAFFTPTTETEQADFFSNLNKLGSARGPSSNRGQPVASVDSAVSVAPRSSDVAEVTVDLTHASPNLLPLVQFPKEKEKAQRTLLLIKIWLTIAGFYRRAGVLDDGRAAVAEAEKLLTGMEAESTGDLTPASAAARGANWANRKTIDDLWGDIWSELGLLGVAKDLWYAAKSDFETALTHSPDHAVATVELSNILLDMYTEKLLPPPVLPPLDGSDDTERLRQLPSKGAAAYGVFTDALPSTPLGLGPSTRRPSAASTHADAAADAAAAAAAAGSTGDELPAPYKATRLPLVDRLAARERAFTLLSGLTRLGAGWDNSDAWFALARAHEESGQVEKAKEVLWWCVELEEAKGVRDWRCLGNGGYVI
ncbi:uncharacterized protein UV8b_03564 [Ustilaginoidea virens]|uniref:Filamentation protein (Rhf1) n=1 Tax=Ustilaginoidea virens TaxID=1159556 RepID=A0A8E5MGA0_USTVR|nr:uncharacterized protein UV8b_03564 [Ustilaginoidea virens]QUC19323.1 hypothetical protein UV8b_03564 [Ustilaginoidea virens]